MGNKVRLELLFTRMAKASAKIGRLKATSSPRSCVSATGKDVHDFRSDRRRRSRFLSDRGRFLWFHCGRELSHDFFVTEDEYVNFVFRFGFTISPRLPDTVLCPLIILKRKRWSRLLRDLKRCPRFRRDHGSRNYDLAIAGDVHEFDMIVGYVEDVIVITKEVYYFTMIVGEAQDVVVFEDNFVFCSWLE